LNDQPLRPEEIQSQSGGVGLGAGDPEFRLRDAGRVAYLGSVNELN